MLDNFRVLGEQYTGLTFTLNNSDVMMDGVGKKQKTGFVRVRVAAPIPVLLLFIPPGASTANLDWSTPFYLPANVPETLELAVGTKIAAKSVSALSIGVTGNVYVSEGETRT